MVTPARIRTSALLESAFRIRPGEGRLAGLMFAYLLAIVSTFIISRTVRDTLFLHRVSLESLPAMYIAVAANVAGASYAYSRVADSMRRDRLIVRGLALSVITILTFYTFLRLGEPPVYFYGVLYVAVEILGAISMIQFWTLAGDIFSGRQGKRLFGFIGAGGVLANVVCGFSVGALAPILGTEQLLLVVASLFVICLFLVRAIAQHSQDELDLAIQKPKRKNTGMSRDAGAVLHSTHLKLIACLVVVTFLTVTVIDYQFKVIARTALTDEAQLAAFFGNFFGVSGIIASLCQLFITGRLLERAGLFTSLLVLPSMIALGIGSMAFVPLLSPLFAVTLAKGAENIFRYTINDATSQLLYAPVPATQRGRAKAFIDGILKPTSIGFAGLGLFVLSYFALIENIVMYLAWLSGALLTLWVLIVLRMKGAYVHSLIHSLQVRRLDPNEAHTWAATLSKQAISTLKTQLNSERDEEVLHALEIATKANINLHSELKNLLKSPSTQIRISVLETLAEQRRFDSIALVQDRLLDPVATVRAAAIHAFCATRRERAIRVVRPYLSDKALEVRGAACSALITHSGLDGVLAAADCLKQLLGDKESPQARCEAARVLQRVRVTRFSQLVLNLLTDSAAIVRKEAIEAAAVMKSPELVSTLIYLLADPACSRSAVRALARFGSGIEPTLIRVLLEKREILAVRRKIPAVLGLINGRHEDTLRGGSERALKSLLQVLKSSDIPLRTEAAREAARIRQYIPRAKIAEELLSSAIRRELHGAYQILATIEDLQLTENDLLTEALELRFQSRRTIIFRLLEIRYPGREIELVRAHLSASARRIRANAIEILENTISRDEARAFLPLLEDINRTDKLRRGLELFPLRRQKPDVWFPKLLEDAHPWTVACTLRLIADRGVLSYGEHILKHTTHRDPIVRETAFATLAELKDTWSSPNKTIETLARSAATDPADEVKRASAYLLEVLGFTPATGQPAGSYT